MALIYSPSISNCFMLRGIMGAMSGVSLTSTFYQPQPNPTVAITVYSGTQPSAASITASWASYNTNYLFHQPGVSYIMPNFQTAGAGAFLSRNNSPTAVTATNTGTASWCIIWCSNVAAGIGTGQISSSTIPNVNFIVGPVTLSTSTGLVTLTSLSVNGGTTATILDSTLTLSIG